MVVQAAPTSVATSKPLRLVLLLAPSTVTSVGLTQASPVRRDPGATVTRRREGEYEMEYWVSRTTK